MIKIFDRLEVEKLVCLYNNREFSKCLEIAKRLTDEEQINSPWLFWLIGVCEDLTGNQFNGLTYLKQALASDPYNHTYISAVSGNLSYFKDFLNSSLDDSTSLEMIQKTHHFLVSAGEFNSTLQYLVIKNYIKHKSFDKAELVLQNYLLNNPNDDEALMLEGIIDSHINQSQAA